MDNKMMNESIHVFREKLEKMAVSEKSTVSAFEYGMATSLGARDKNGTSKRSPYIDYIIRNKDRHNIKLIKKMAAMHEPLYDELDGELILMWKTMDHQSQRALNLLEQEKENGKLDIPPNMKEKIRESQRNIYLCSKKIHEEFNQISHDVELALLIINMRTKKTEKLIRIYLGLTNENVSLDEDLRKRIYTASKIEMQFLEKYSKYSDLYLLLTAQSDKWFYLKNKTAQ